MNYDLLTIGDVSIDEYIKVDDAEIVCDIDRQNCRICFPYSGKIPVVKYETSLAGNAHNVAVGCAMLGMKSAIYAEMGDDQNADTFIKEYEKVGVEASFVRKNFATPTNVHQIISYKDERTILSYHEPYEYKVSDWGKPKWIFYASLPKNFEEFQSGLVEYLKANPEIGVVFGPGTYHLKAGVEKIRDILEVTDILFVNKEEACQLAGFQNGALKADWHKKLRELGPKLTIITDGKNGSSAYDGENFAEFGVVQSVVVKDKTGAGDAFAAGVLAALHYGSSLSTALKWGTVNAGGVIREIGSTNGLLTKSQIERKWRKWGQPLFI